MQEGNTPNDESFNPETLTVTVLFWVLVPKLARFSCLDRYTQKGSFASPTLVASYTA